MATKKKKKDLGKEAYEADLALTPTYHNGEPRPQWTQLPLVARRSWREKAEADA